MTSKFLGKTGIKKVLTCSFCDNPCKEEQYQISHNFSSGQGTVKTYCSIECLREEMGVNEHINQEVEKRTREELNWLHKQICPRCRMRILKNV